MSLHRAVLLFTAASAPRPDFDIGRLDNGTIEIERRDARRCSWGEVHAV
jgi:hypothetical protein